MMQIKSSKQKLKKLDNLISKLIIENKLSSKSMIMTIFGDVVSLYSGTISLIKLIKIAQLFDFNDRLTRTSVCRLSKENLLNQRQKKNKSYYHLSDQGQLLFYKSKDKVYTRIEQEDVDYWTLVFIGEINEKHKIQLLSKQLSYHGFASLTKGLLFYPKPHHEVYSVARDLGIENQIIIYEANLTKHTNEIFIKQLIKQHWNLDQIVQYYEKFNSQFGEIFEVIKNEPISDIQALQLRLLLIHIYRKIILKDPILPKIWLPSYWPYEKSYQLCSHIYQLVYKPSKKFLEKEIFNIEAHKNDRFIK